MRLRQTLHAMSKSRASPTLFSTTSTSRFSLTQMANGACVFNPHYTGFPLVSWQLDLDSGRVELQVGGVPGISPSSSVDCTKFTLASNLM